MKATVTHSIPISGGVQKQIDSAMDRARGLADEIGLSVGHVPRFDAYDYPASSEELSRGCDAAASNMDRQMKGWTRDKSKGVSMMFTGPLNALRCTYQCQYVTGADGDPHV